MADITTKKGDRLPSINAVLKDINGPVDLTGASVKFLMKSGTTLKINAAATIVTPAAGAVRYDWGATDTDTAGNFIAEFEVTDGAGKKSTFPNGGHLEVLILEDLG